MTARTTGPRFLTALVVLGLTTALHLVLGAPRAQADTVERTYSGAAGTRNYFLHVPPGGAAGKPLMVYLHGCGDGLVERPPTGFSLTRVADELGFVLAYPLQSGAAHPLHCWNWSDQQHQQRDKGEPALIAGITTTLVHELRLDRSKVYVGGYSAGGAMTTTLGATYPDLYAAIAPMAGAPYRAQPGGKAIHDAMGTRARPMPTFFMQNVFDEMSIYPIGRANLQQWLDADNLAEPGAVSSTPNDISAAAAASPVPASIERYAGRGGCQLALFSATQTEHIFGASILQKDLGLDFQRTMMRWLLGHRMTTGAHACG